MGVLDLLYLSIGAAFFLAADGFVVALDRLAGRNATGDAQARR